MNQYGHAHSIPSDDPRQQKWAEQREARGFDDTETWGLDNTIVKFVLPRLKRFREVVISHPHAMTMEEWKATLDEMIAGFEQMLDRDSSGYDHEKADKGMALFAKWFHDLWD